MPQDASLFVILKAIHMITLSITISGFALRGYWMLQDSPLLKNRMARTLPHINDTILFVSAVWAAILINQYPFVDAWLTAKVIGAIAYILLGAVALTYGPTKRIRACAFCGSLICFAYVVGVAATRNPLIFGS
jgi:uncharacterized membrane protein SirB2